MNFELRLIPDWDGDFEIFLYLGAGYRYFTNVGHRVNKGKHISGNSGDYVALINRLLVAAPLLGNFEYDSSLLLYRRSSLWNTKDLQRSILLGSFVWPCFFYRG
ncbi:hypothetical protein [Maribacter antarcticus]|uniref:hypothetical protein n=1 Tax=Maribacter antarcticus TaxID=505250 RepID=UPI00047E0E51|nr:hypothetical protein [Maribacter antarcticus]